jgi:predicted ATPase
MKTKFFVITGGPGAGKTAVLEMARHKFLGNCLVLPEAASIVFSGGFLRLPSPSAKCAAQRAIFHVQDELERLVVEEQRWKIALCDRGTLDGLAYWPLDEIAYWSQIGSDLHTELAKYHAVIHLRTPSTRDGYNNDYKLRTESAVEAQKIDQRIEQIWCAHPNYVQIPSFSNFLEKATCALERIQLLMQADSD